MWNPVRMSSQQDSDVVFAGSIPRLYESYLVPLIFQPYADDLADRLVKGEATSVLELAAGTGVVTRAMADRLPANVAIPATDLNQPMIDHAPTNGTSRPETWRQADALDLPFDDESFDAIVCQFGVMFFPDRYKAYLEIHRVLRPGGVALFNVWDSLEYNDFANVVTQALATVFTDDPPRFLARTPYAYNDTELIRAEVLAGGFDSTSTIDTVNARSKAATCSMPAIGFCQGTPLRTEIEGRDPDSLAAATNVAAGAIGDRFGKTNVDGAIRAHVISAIKV
jgi:SAM-dependent methyltransferase